MLASRVPAGSAMGPLLRVACSQGLLRPRRPWGLRRWYLLVWISLPLPEMMVLVPRRVLDLLPGLALIRLGVLPHLRAGQGRLLLPL